MFTSYYSMKRIQFSDNEIRGYIAILVALFILIAFRIYIYNKSTGLLIDQFSIIKLEGQPVREQKNEPVNQIRPFSKRSRQDEKQLFVFDPNTIAKDSLDQLPIPSFVRNNLLKYRKSGGRFSAKQDMKKIYGLSDENYLLIEPYIQIQADSKTYLRSSSQHEKKYTDKTNYPSSDKSEESLEKISIDLNTASKEELSRLRGIGPVLSDRIVKYRESLGGFYTVDQLKEVFGLQDSVYISIRDNLQLNQVEIEKISINVIEFKELLKHPYADYETTKLILNYREQHGEYGGKDDFKGIYRLDRNKLEKLLPYLDFSVSKKESMDIDKSE